MTARRHAAITITSWWVRLSPASPALRSFTQPFIQALIKENIKPPRYWPLWGEFSGDRWIPCAKASNAENVSIWWRHHDFVSKYWYKCPFHNVQQKCYHFIFIGLYVSFYTSALQWIIWSWYLVYFIHWSQPKWRKFCRLLVRVAKLQKLTWYSIGILCLLFIKPWGIFERRELPQQLPGSSGRSVDVTAVVTGDALEAAKHLC